MSLALIEAEIGRFLDNTCPEVLCIIGKWGVGKTYAWKKFFADAKRARKLAYKTYSYVTLFGLNSIDDVRYSIFESRDKEIGDSHDAGTFKTLFARSIDLGRKSRPLIDAGLSLFNRKGVADTLFKTAFSLVSNQFVCLDDLERAGQSLEVRDVLGLASFLKEERNCKVVLLLNDEQMDGNNRAEFHRQLEKVADVTLVFDLSPEEAVRIALPDDQLINTLLRPRIVDLGITNIRVIKKIERLAARLADLLNAYDHPTLEQAIATLALGSWSVQQPGIAPPIDFIRGYNCFAVIASAGRGQVDPTTTRWHETLRRYSFTAADEMDSIILDGARYGYFNEADLKEKATLIQRQAHQQSRDNSFNRAWEELYRGSLATDDDDFLDALYRGAVENLEAISPMDINSAVRMLRQYHRPDKADDLVSKYVEARRDENLKFFKLRHHPFLPDDKVDDGLLLAFDNRVMNHVDERDPFEVLRSGGKGRGWDDADIALLAKQSADDFERMFETLRGEELRQSIDMVLTTGRSNRDGCDVVQFMATEALRRIATKSPMRKQKVRSFGIEV